MSYASSCPLNPARVAHPTLSLDALAARIGELFAVTPEELRSGSRRTRRVEAGSVFCFWAIEHGNPAAHVAHFLTMTPPAGSG
jgi:hypothetical protein